MSVFVFTIVTDEVSAMEKSDRVVAEIISDGDLYVESTTPAKISFEVRAVDEFNNQIPVQCDKTSNSFFSVGKTTVRCLAIDSSGNEFRDSFEVTVGYRIVQIPDWFKHTTEYWTSQNMSNEEYFETLEFLFDEEIIHMPQTKIPKENSDIQIPVWINTNAVKWSEGNLSNDEFSIGIQWMLDRKII
jgi:hypothetical protein